MSNKSKFFFIALIVSLTFALAGTAEAARFGGGKSFGSKPSYSMPYKRSAEGSAANPAPQHTAPTTAPNPAQTAGKRSGLMGMLGGLAIGGLLGSLLFGGAFHGINPLDILLFGAVAFLAFKLLAGRRSQPRPVAGYQRQADAGDGPAGFDTDILSHKGAPVAPVYRAEGVKPAIPADFAVEGFLEGAKSAYRHLQSAWDQGDLAEIRGLATDRVFAEIQDQYRARQGENRTELLKLEAELLEVRDRDNDREASVLFDVLMRESRPAGESLRLPESDDERPKQVREVWHFIRSKTSRQPTWFLDGIQQLED